MPALVFEKPSYEVELAHSFVRAHERLETPPSEIERHAANLSGFLLRWRDDEPSLAKFDPSAFLDAVNVAMRAPRA